MKHPKIPFLLAITTAGLLLYGCFLGPEREPCTGRLILENPIPDTTVAVGDTLFIDLAYPPAFVSSEGRVSYFPSLNSGFFNVDVNRISNPNDGGKVTLLRIIGREIGEGILQLEAKSGCLENQTMITINVTE